MSLEVFNPPNDEFNLKSIFDIQCRSAHSGLRSGMLLLHNLIFYIKFFFIVVAEFLNNLKKTILEEEKKKGENWICFNILLVSCMLCRISLSTLGK